MFYFPKLKMTAKFLILITVLLSASVLQADNVLVIQSYSPDYEWTKQIQQGITEEIRKSCPETHIYSEYIDAKRKTEQYYGPSY